MNTFVSHPTSQNQNWNTNMEKDRYATWLRKEYRQGVQCPELKIIKLSNMQEQLGNCFQSTASVTKAVQVAFLGVE